MCISFYGVAVLDGLTGAELDAYVEKLGWTTTGDVVAVPPNPDNHIEATVVQESIKLPRKCTSNVPVITALADIDFRTDQGHRSRRCKAIVPLYSVVLSLLYYLCSISLPSGNRLLTSRARSLKTRHLRPRSASAIPRMQTQHINKLYIAFMLEIHYKD